MGREKKVFYRWKPRFETGGYAALDVPQSHAPKHPRKIAPDVSKRVVAMKRAHPTWGKRRMADELAKRQSWVRVVSPNTVKRILKEANPWPEATHPEKKASGRARTADIPGQTLNVDLCFVPATHTATTQKLPAVSGSSGHLVIERPRDPLQEKSWPGQIFEDEQLEYSEAMLAFVEASQPDPVSPDSESPSGAKRETDLAAQKRALRAEEARLRAQRRRIRQKRRQEDDTWRTMKQLYHAMSTPQESVTSDDQEFVKNGPNGPSASIENAPVRSASRRRSPLAPTATISSYSLG